MPDDKDKLIKSLQAEKRRLEKHVHDLQSGMYINCVYCGHRFGPKDKVKATMADALKQHIEECPLHPMSILKAKFDRVDSVLVNLYDWLYFDSGDQCFDPEKQWDSAADFIEYANSQVLRFYPRPKAGSKKMPKMREAEPTQAELDKE